MSKDYSEFYLSDSLPPRLYEHKDEVAFHLHVNTFDFPKNHAHMDYIEFTIITNGELYNIINDKKILLKSGTMFYQTQNDIHYLKKTGSSPLRYINISIREDMFDLISNMLSPRLKDFIYGDFRIINVSPKFINTIENKIHKIGFLNENDYESYSDLVKSAFILIMEKYYSLMIEENNESLKLLNLFNTKNIGNDYLKYSVQDLANLFDCSRQYLNKIFKEQYRMTPHEYLIQLKMGYAKNALENTTMSISEIASNIGYISISQFIEAFKKEFHCTPLQYRNGYKET